MSKANAFNVDEAQAEITLADAAVKCGVHLDIDASKKEVRIDCPFGCGGDHAGRKDISVNTAHPAKLWKCHAYGCELKGNLLALMHGWLTGRAPAGGRPKGDEFKLVRDVLRGEEGGPAAKSEATATEKPQAEAKEREEKPKENTPLLRSDDPKIRCLMEPPLWEKLIRDVPSMNPKASAYVRRHGALSPEAMEKWNVGVMPTDGGGDKRGTSLRGNVVFTLRNTEGEVLGFAGRNVKYEEEERAFAALSDDERKTKKPPMKYRFPKSYHRGIELFGQQNSRLEEPGYRESIAKHGVIIVEGMTDVIGLDNHGVPAVGICSNRITDEQVQKVAGWAKDVAGGKVSLLLDCEERGDEGAKEAAFRLLEEGLDVRLGWSQMMHGGEFRGRQPESLSKEELFEKILPELAR